MYCFPHADISERTESVELGGAVGMLCKVNETQGDVIRDCVAQT